MIVLEINQKDLKEGKSFIFSTPENQDDFRQAEITYNKKSGYFRIRFNGGFIHISKTFDSMIKRFKVLQEKWSLSFTEIQED